MKKTNKLLVAISLAFCCAPMVLAAAHGTKSLAPAFADDESYTVIVDMDGKQDNFVFEDVKEGTNVTSILINARNQGMKHETEDSYLYSFIDRDRDSFETYDEYIGYAEYCREYIVYNTWYVDDNLTLYSVWVDYEETYTFDAPRNFKLDKDVPTQVPPACLYNGNYYFMGGQCAFVTISYEFSPLVNAVDESNYTDLELYTGIYDYSHATVDETDIMLNDADSQTYGNKPFFVLNGETLPYIDIDGVGEEEQFAAIGESKIGGKIAVVNRGGITFFEKIERALNYGAVGVIVINNQPGTINMNIDGYAGGYLPIASTLQESREHFIAAGEKTTVDELNYYIGTFAVEEGTEEYCDPYSDFEIMYDAFSPTLLGGGGEYTIESLYVKLADSSVIDDNATYYSDLTITVTSYDEKNNVTKIEVFYACAYLSPGYKYTIYFFPNGGSGSQDNDGCLIDEGGLFDLPECTFIAPEGMEFDYWDIDGNEYQPGDTIVVEDDVYITAQWKESQGGGGDSGSGSGGDTPDNPNKKGLPAGAIVGIVLGSVLVLGLGGFAIFWFVIKKKSFKDLIAIFKKKQ